MNAQVKSSEDLISRVVIRPALDVDAQAIHAMLTALADDIGAPSKMTATVEDIRRQGFGAAPVFEALIAEVDHAAVGLCLFFTSFSSWRGTTGLYVQDLYVSEAMRGTGLGRGLLREVAALGRERGGSYLRLAVDAANIDGQGFYERLGLNWRKSERLYEISNGDFEMLAEGVEGNGDEQA